MTLREFFAAAMMLSRIEDHVSVEAKMTRYSKDGSGETDIMYRISHKTTDGTRFEFYEGDSPEKAILAFSSAILGKDLPHDVDMAITPSPETAQVQP